MKFYLRCFLPGWFFILISSAVFSKDSSHRATPSFPADTKDQKITGITQTTVAHKQLTDSLPKPSTDSEGNHNLS
ncbi:MAG TPA: hypothetical protein VGI38_10850, partial [Puia sp.]